MNKNYFIPFNLELDALVYSNYPEFKPFKKDKLAYILSLLNELRISNKDLVYNSYTPLNAQVLQEYIKNYKQYLDYLIHDLKIIESDNMYIAGEKSRGFRFVDEYQTLVKPYKIMDWTMKKKMKVENNKALLTVKNLKYLTKWFDGLEINFDKCYDFIKQEYQIKNKYKELRDYDVVKGQYKIPLHQLNRSLIAISNIDNKTYFLKRDSNVSRFHSNLTNVNSMMRNGLTYKGEKLVSIDITNCQPYLSTILFRKEFWRKEYKDSGYINFYNIRNSINYYIMLGEMPVPLVNKGVERYVDLVVNGRFYEYLQDQFKEELGLDYVDRKQVKTAVFQTLFTGNRFIGQNKAAPKRLFAKLFPEVYEVFKQMKKKDKTLLPRMLQSIESYLIVDVICKRISKELPKAPIFTIHDSIATTPVYVEQVKNIMLDECKKGIGFEPKLKLEYWNEENMDMYIGELKNRISKSIA